jgi:hypothetical protein
MTPLLSVLLLAPFVEPDTTFDGVAAVRFNGSPESVQVYEGAGFTSIRVGDRALVLDCRESLDGVEVEIELEGHELAQARATARVIFLADAADGGVPEFELITKREANFDYHEYRSSPSAHAAGTAKRRGEFLMYYTGEFPALIKTVVQRGSRLGIVIEVSWPPPVSPLVPERVWCDGIRAVYR